MNRLIIDLEANGLLMDATKIWVVCGLDLDTGAKFEIYEPKDLQDVLDRYDRIIGHNVIMYDLPILNKLWGIVYDINRVIDSLLISRLVLPDRPGGHSLKAWGKRIGLYKGDHTEFNVFSPEMVAYCHQDVEVTAKVYEALKDEVATLFNSGSLEMTVTDDATVQYRTNNRLGAKGIKKSIDLEHAFAHVMSKQVLSGFPLDKMRVENLYQELFEEYTPLKADVSGLMPKVKVMNHYKSVKPENIISETKTSYTYIQDKTRKVVTKEFKFEDPNCGSRQQLVNWFKSKGWKPKEFTDKGSPEINEKILLEIGTDEAKKVARMFRLQKQMGMIKDGDGAWLKYYNQQTGRVHGNVNTNATNTGRASHSQPNMAQVDKKDLRMREVWIAPEGRVLIGTDAAGLELRVLGHYLYPYDKGAFAIECVSGDIHTYNQNLMQLKERNSAKTAIYGLIYGAGNEKLGSIYAADQKIYGSDQKKLQYYGSLLRKSVEENFTGYKELLAKIQEVYKQRGFLIGIDGRPLHPRSDYSALNLLIQSAGAVICKQWVINMYNLLCKQFTYGQDFEFHANIHDEQGLSCRPEILDEVLKIPPLAMSMAQEMLQVKTKLDVDTKTGKNWKETH